MLESSTFWWAVLGVVAAGCAVDEPKPEPPAAPPPAPAVVAPSTPPVDTAAEEAKALLAQAETDVQRARAKRALWSKAWEDLVAARQAAAQKDYARTSRLARRASELAVLGLEQLAYPPVR
jgi:hypothetical protein